MGHLLAIFLSLFSISANAMYAPSTFGGVPVCGMLLAPTNLIHCFSRVTSGSNRAACARAGDNGTSPSDYSAGKGTVGGANAANGKAFRLVAVKYTIQTSSSSTGPQLWYADVDLGISSSSAFTNGVNFIGVASNNGYVGSSNAVTTANNTMDPGVSCAYPNWLIPNGKFPSIQGDGTNVYVAELFGYEE